MARRFSRKRSVAMSRKFRTNSGEMRVVVINQELEFVVNGISNPIVLEFSQVAKVLRFLRACHHELALRIEDRKLYRYRRRRNPNKPRTPVLMWDEVPTTFRSTVDHRWKPHHITDDIRCTAASRPWLNGIGDRQRYQRCGARKMHGPSGLCGCHANALETIGRWTWADEMKRFAYKTITAHDSRTSGHLVTNATCGCR